MKQGMRVLVCALVLSSVYTCQGLAISTSARSAALIEQKSGRVLYEQAAQEERLIASITKIMTAVVALEYGDIRAEYTVTAEDMAEGSSMYLRPGETLTLEELLYGLMLSSGNDAALAVAHCVSGTTEKFVELMNSTAHRLGLEHSSFANPNGLDAEGHYSSAEDMARLAAYALGSETFRRIVSTSTITIGERSLTNHNKLLRLYDGCIGVKTGYTKAAGRTLVSAARRDGMTLVCVTLSDGNDWNDHAALLDHGFATYHMETPVFAGTEVANVLVRGGSVPLIPLRAAADLSYPLTEGEKLQVTVRVPISVSAPVIPGDVIGQAVTYLDGQEVAAVDLLAAAPSAAMVPQMEKETTRWQWLPRLD